MNILKECLIVNIQIGTWLGYRLDKTMTSKVTREADAAPDAARVNKHLVAKEMMSDIQSAASAVRNHFYNGTLPWKDNGDRLLTRKLSMKFIEDHQELKRKFDAAVKDFLDNKYIVAQEQAEFRMGELFDPNDYPSTAVIARKFYVNLDIDGVAQAHDIRLDNSTEVLQARVTKAIGGLWERLAGPMARFTEAMGDENAIFRNTTVSNLREIVEMIPELNFTDDPALERIRSEIEKHLVVYEADDLRKDKKTRAVVAGQAREIMGQMQGFMNAFGHGGEDE